MTISTTLLPHHQKIVDRFVAVCLADSRILAAFLGGSYAAGTADAYSDLDLFLLTTDEAYEAFLDDKNTFIQQLGEPLFLEDWGAAHYNTFVLADGTEGECHTAYRN